MNITRSLSQHIRDPVAVPLVVGILLFGVLCAVFWPFTVDDSFITFRYARNLTQGYGPTFNPGAPPAEGYTSFLWMLLTAIPNLTGGDCVVFAKAAGVAAMLGVILLLAPFTKLLVKSPGLKGHWTAGVPVLFLAAIPGTAVHAVSGMETAIFTLLLTGLLYAVTVLVEFPSHRICAVTAVLGLLLGLTRPEGNLVTASAVACALTLVRRESRRRVARYTMGLYVLPGALYFLWRISYYDHLFPLPFYLKVASSSGLAGLNEWVIFAKFFTLRFGVLLLVAFCGVSRSVLPAILSLGVFLVFFVFPDPVMNYESRFLYPIVPIICILAGNGVVKLREWMIIATGSDARLRHRVALLSIVGVVGLELGLGVHDAVSYTQRYARGMEQAHIPLGKALCAVTKEEGPLVLAIGDAGAVPYYSGWFTIDTFGLNDPEIATTNLHRPDHVLSQSPDVVVLISRSDSLFVPELRWEEDLYESCMGHGYSLAGILPVNRMYHLWIMCLSRSAVMQQLQDGTAFPPVMRVTMPYPLREESH